MAEWQSGRVAGWQSDRVSEGGIAGRELTLVFESETKGDHFNSKVIIKSDDHLIIFRF